MRRNPRLRPATEGWMLLLPLMVIWLAATRVVPRLAPLSLLTAGAVALTFRDPERPFRPQSEMALAPADGRVIHVCRVWDDYWQQELMEIGIFLALWDVHIQRSPLDGEVVAQRRKAGGYKPAMSQAATYGNNQLATYLRSDAGPCVVTQISGLVARRIVSWTPPGTSLAQGQRLGMIKLSSQTTLRVPVDSDVLVKIGDKVRAGQTPLAKLRVDRSAVVDSDGDVSAQRNSNRLQNA